MKTENITHLSSDIPDEEEQDNYEDFFMEDSAHENLLEDRFIGPRPTLESVPVIPIPNDELEEFLEIDPELTEKQDFVFIDKLIKQKARVIGNREDISIRIRNFIENSPYNISNDIDIII